MMRKRDNKIDGRKGIKSELPTIHIIGSPYKIINQLYIIIAKVIYIV